MFALWDAEEDPDVKHTEALICCPCLKDSKEEIFAGGYISEHIRVAWLHITMCLHITICLPRLSFS